MTNCVTIFWMRTLTCDTLYPLLVTDIMEVTHWTNITRGPQILFDLQQVSNDGNF